MVTVKKGQLSIILFKDYENLIKKVKLNINSSLGNMNYCIEQIHKFKYNINISKSHDIQRFFICPKQYWFTTIIESMFDENYVCWLEKGKI